MEIPSSLAAAKPAEPSSPDQQRLQLARLAHEFEAIFLNEMLRGMRESMLPDDENEGLGADAMTATFDSELSRSLSGAGGFGLASVLLEALDRRYGAPSLSAEVAAGAGPEPVAASPVVVSPSRDALARAVPSGAGAAEALAPVARSVSSAFGWRPDPFTGHTRFHNGTDIRMAYGEDVRAVAPGRVVSASDRGGYGLTVVIDHGNGLETRYAHLSAFTVREGDRVEAGQVVAQAGSSGRSTGPHLHLEARRHGRPVEWLGALKQEGLVADLAGSQSQVRSSHED